MGSGESRRTQKREIAGVRVEVCASLGFQHGTRWTDNGHRSAKGDACALRSLCRRRPKQRRAGCFNRLVEAVEHKDTDRNAADPQGRKP